MYPQEASLWIPFMFFKHVLVHDYQHDTFSFLDNINFGVVNLLLAAGH